MNKSKVITGYLTNEHDLLEAVNSLKAQGVKVLDVRSPHPVHGLEKVMDFKPSNIGIITFIAGGAAFLFTLGAQVVISSQVYPIMYGGKPLVSIPSFMPITLMVTLLVSIITAGVTFFIQNKLGPGAVVELLNEGATDDKYQIIIDGSFGEESLRSVNCLEVQVLEVANS